MRGVVVQPRQEGTGNAVRIALESVGQISGVVVVTLGDTPLLRSQTLADLVAAHHADQNAVTALTARVPDPTGYGRIVLDDRGRISEIVEEAGRDAGAARDRRDQLRGVRVRR